MTKPGAVNGLSAPLWSPDLAFELAPDTLRHRRGVAGGRFASIAIQSPPPKATSAVTIVRPREPKVDTKPASDVLAGALARAASQSTIHPLDTLKVRMQAGMRVTPRLSPDGGAGGVATSLLTGVRKMYRGVLGAASGAGIAVGAYFLVYGVASNAIAKMSDVPVGARAFIAGGIAAAGSSVVKVPIAVCIRSVQAGVYPSAISAARSIVASVGVRGLFTGYLPTLMEDVPDMAVKFACYETLQNSYSRCMGRPANSTEDFFMGALSGALAAAATTPFDVVKTGMMCSAAQRPQLLRSVRELAARGPRALFRGVGPRALSSGVNSAVFFCFFEMLRVSFMDMKAQSAAAGDALAPAVQQA